MISRFFKTMIMFGSIILLPRCSKGQEFRSTRNKPVIKNYVISSKVLNQDRKISIYTPEVFPEYKNAVSPIIYVLEGQAYFDYFAMLVNFICETFVQMPPITVVGIENYVPSTRQLDFTPLVSNDSIQYKQSGGADNYMKFMQQEVIPLVEKGYKQKPYRVITGHSLSSLFVIHAFLKYPTWFNGYLASDPAFHINKNAYLKIADSVIKNSSEIERTLFISAYGNPDSWARFYAGHIDSSLQDRKLKSLSYRYLLYPNETHLSVFLKSFYDGIHFIFNMDPPETGKAPTQISYQMFEDHYNRLSKIFSYHMTPPQYLINEFGYRFLNEWDNVDKALYLFKKNVHNYPLSGRVYQSYGEALIKKGDKQNALINYEKAYQLDPTNTIARDIANKLRSR